MAGDRNSRRTWFDLLGEEDVAFVKRFVLASGSLKEMAKVYGITYPTVRLRLDRLIEKIKGTRQSADRILIRTRGPIPVR